jgi:hypothetical protein
MGFRYVPELLRTLNPWRSRRFSRPCRTTSSFWPQANTRAVFFTRGVGGRAEILTILEFWRGGLPLGRAFWLWGVLGGGVVSLFATLLALMLVAAGAPAWLAVLVFAAHLPWNLVVLVGVWRSAGRPEVSRAAANLARSVILAWVVVLSLL